MTNDDLIAKLGASQQNVMHLTTQKRQLEKRLEKAEHRAEVLEELIMDVVADMQDNVLKSVILERINKVMRRLDADD
jgi:predicted  nucleic acid-binding Zn-ribbon protein